MLENTDIGETVEVEMTIGGVTFGVMATLLERTPGNAKFSVAKEVALPKAWHDIVGKSRLVVGDPIEIAQPLN